jgi:plasmid maintenance system antidote protein VapI
MLMAARKLSAVDLSAFLKVHRSTAARRVNGESDLTIDEIVDIAAWLDVPVTRLINAAVGPSSSSE